MQNACAFFSGFWRKSWLSVAGFVMLLAASAAATPSPVQADSTNVCAVTVGGTSFTASSSNPSVAYYTTKSGDDYFFDITACGFDQSYLSSCEAQGATLRAAVRWHGWMPGWENFPLTKQGSCYAGQIKKHQFGNTEQQAIEVQIQIDGGTANCASGTDLCKRAYGNISTQNSNTNGPQCEAATQKLNDCGSVTFSTPQIVKGQPVTVNFAVDPILAQTCSIGPLQAARLTVYDPSNNKLASACMNGSGTYCDTPGGKFSSCNGGPGLGSCSLTFTPPVASDCDKKGYTIELTSSNNTTPFASKCKVPFGVGTDASSACTAPTTNTGGGKPFALCDQIKQGTKAYDDCLKCTGSAATTTGQTEVKGVWTAIGCIKNDPKVIVKTLITLAVRISGGLSVLLILASAFTFATSSGDAKKHDDAKEKFFRAIFGPIAILMCVTIIQFIGVTIFHIPGFGS